VVSSSAIIHFNLLIEVHSSERVFRASFRSVRPNLGFVSVVIDTALTAMFMRGSLIDFAMAYLRQLEKEKK
jgi:hypothetical protein